MRFFYEGLTTANKRMVDSACKGALMDKTPREAFDQFDFLANNNQQWGSERTKKAGVHKVDTNTAVVAQTSSLEKKHETLMGAVIPSSPQQVCAICSDPTHPMELCPSTTQGFEQVLQVNSFQRPRNDPYSNTYNPGWCTHPNFSWSNQQQQASSTRPIHHQGQPSSEPKKPALEDLVA
ncbi:hypothetical protein L3X38_032696 [Prunus dulcis]|uniref:Retrotransposon gag domain-containing protein n=1 Tax=Prunus dulcis TaxID=3755 RepID=A0AAD4VEH7_PRUDU|nr:hypothetical protein L3X38_032696 [Prunus dulcis]